MAKVFTPYSSLFNVVKAQTLAWVPPAGTTGALNHQERINSYLAYEQLYWNIHEDYKLITRGTEESAAIYVPRPMTIVETHHRYVGTGMDYLLDEETGTPASRELGTQMMEAFFRRERVISKYTGAKRFGIMKGDWVFHLMADPNKPQGSRLRFASVQPEAYFPQYLDDDPERLWKVHLVERFTREGKNFVRRLTYERTLVDNGAGSQTPGSPILWSLTEFPEAKWFVNDYLGEEGVIIVPPTELPPDTPSIPVYHIPNFDEPGNRFGSSSLRGFERVLGGINQAVSDEDLALALMGLGVYATESTAQPRDPQGNAVPWTIWPGKVLQGATGLRKVEGITSIEPNQHHIGFLLNEIGLASGASAAATGSVDVSVAESGVALAMHLAPMLAMASEKDNVIEDVLTQLFFDLKAWFRMYEQADFTDVDIVPVFGDKLPVNKTQEIANIAAMMSTEPPLMSAQTARTYLKERCGIEFADNEGDLVLMEREAITIASAASTPASPAGLPAADPDAARQAAEQAAQNDGAPTNEGVG